MKKRFLSLALALVLAALMMIPAGFAEDNSIPSSAGNYYVYTENGKGLNVRDTPGGAVVGSLKYGTKVYCYYNQDGWALIDYTYDKPGYGKGTYAAFVSSRYLQKSKPGPKPTPDTPSSSSDPISDLNEEFRSARKVDAYKVTVRPTRASGWVNLRWAPSMKAEILATYSANSQLLVLKETKNWLQVEDQDTGDIGFIKKDFVSK